MIVTATFVDGPASGQVKSVRYGRGPYVVALAPEPFTYPMDDLSGFEPPSYRTVPYHIHECRYRGIVPPIVELDAVAYVASVSSSPPRVNIRDMEMTPSVRLLPKPDFINDFVGWYLWTVWDLAVKCRETRRMVRDVEFVMEEIQDHCGSIGIGGLRRELLGRFVESKEMCGATNT